MQADPLTRLNQSYSPDRPALRKQGEARGLFPRTVATSPSD
jgi:hypothetical protein